MRADRAIGQLLCIKTDFTGKVCPTMRKSDIPLREVFEVHQHNFACFGNGSHFTCMLCFTAACKPTQRDMYCACGKLFRNRQYLTDHERLCTVQKVLFNCSLCGTSFNTVNELCTHYGTVEHRQNTRQKRARSADAV